MALGVEADALLAGQLEEHRPTGEHRQEARLALDAEVLLAAKPSARRDLGHANAPLGEAQERRDLPPVLPGSLTLGVDVEQGSVLVRAVRHDEACLRLQEGMLDRLGAERLRHDVGGPCQGRIDVAPADDRLGEEIPARMDEGSVLGERRERVGDRLEHLVFDVDERRSLAGRLSGLCGDRGENVSDVPGGLPLGNQLRPIRHDQPLLATARDVSPRDDAHNPRVRCCAGHVDSSDDGPRMIGEAQRSVQHPADHHVPDELLLAEGERAALVARRARSDLLPGAAVVLWRS